MILSDGEVRAMSALALAHMGDAVYEILARREVCRSGKLTAGELHRQTIRYVSAPAQARAAEKIRPHLTGEEEAVYRRGRNAQAKHAAPKHADPADYAHATGLEALWGYLYVTKQTDRLDTLIRLAILRTEDIWHKQS